jgi:PTH1 family peptidyl-tRNA hydrolase
MEPIRLVVGLGNPGREHAATRHNAGYWFADALAAKLGVGPTARAKFHGQGSQGRTDSVCSSRALHEPLGRSVSSLSRFSR